MIKSENHYNPVGEFELKITLLLSTLKIPSLILHRDYRLGYALLEKLELETGVCHSTNRPIKKLKIKTH